LGSERKKFLILQNFRSSCSIYAAWSMWTSQSRGTQLQLRSSVAALVVGGRAPPGPRPGPGISRAVGGEQRASGAASLPSGERTRPATACIRQGKTSYISLILSAKEIKRITGSSRGKVKPLLPDNPYDTNPHKSFITQSLTDNSDEGNPSPPFFGRGHYAPPAALSQRNCERSG
jgi:hypothetical protein